MASRHPVPDSRGAEAAEAVTTVGADTGRRRFLGYLLAAPTLAAAGSIVGGVAGSPSNGGSLLGPATADALPSNPQVADLFDLEDALTFSAAPTANLTAVQMQRDGSVVFAIPRAEVGQGITTSFAQIIAEEMELPIDKVHITLADARPELVFNQLTGGSNTMNSLYTSTRIAAAVAKGKLLEAAGYELQDLVGHLIAKGGIIFSTLTQQRISYGDLAEKAASMETKPVHVELKDEKSFKIVGKATRRVDARDAVQGKKMYPMDMEYPGAVRTMVCRAPTINGTPTAFKNIDKVRSMPGVTDVAMIKTGVAIGAKTFGQCIDAVRVVEATFKDGPEAKESDDTVLKELKDAALPELIPGIPGAKVVEAEYAFSFASNSALETGCAIADVKKNSAEIWASQKIPITAQAEIAEELGMPQTAVKLHVMTGGGSFGRHLFHDFSSDAAEASKAFGKPVKLMWHRTDDFRQGRTHPMSFSRIRANVIGDNVLSYEQHHASVRTDFSHGFGEAISSAVTRLPLAGLSVSEIIFETTANVPYSFGVTKQLLNETHQNVADNQYYGGFKTTSMRNVYSPDVVTAHELFIDKLGRAVGKDPYKVRMAYAKDDKFRAVIQKAAELGGWNTPLPKGFGRGLGVHREYKNTMCCFIELDCTPATVNRKVRDAITGPRVTKAIFVTIPGGMVVNPMGFEALIQGGMMDGIAVAMTSGLHLKNGTFMEGSWDHYAYTRQWNVPAEMQVYLMPADKSEKICGAGEAGVAPSKAAAACAYVNATGKLPKMWPVAHDNPLFFTPDPTVPSIPAAPTDGLDYAY